MKTSIIIIAASGLLIAGCGDKSGPNAAGKNSSGSGSSPANGPGDYVGALGKGQQNAIRTVDTASLNQAIQMFNVDKGRNPKDLNELVKEKFIPKIPEAPVGMKIDYDATSGKVQVVKQ
jgi:hypothetical protein